MEKDNRNQAAVMPYEKLAMLGIDRGKAESLPQEIKDKLSSGEVTPIVQVSISARNGNVITLPLKLQMVADRNGNPALLAYPVRAALETERNKAIGLTEHEAERLRRGEVIQKTVDADGGKTRQYLQLDPETKSVIHRKVTDNGIDQKLRDMEKVNDIELGTLQKQQVREGKPVELNVGGEKVAVGIDLREPQGFRVIKGGLKEWERQQKIRYDELHPEFYGFVQTEKNSWEYRKVVDSQSVERAIRLSSPKEERGKRLKL